MALQPQDQQYVSLGHFSNQNLPRGFAVDMEPEPDTHEAVVTQVVHIEANGTHRFTLHAANYGAQPVTVTVWQV